MRLRALVLLCGAAAVSASCQTRAPSQPVAIAYGEDVCAACDQVIKERRHAAEYLLSGAVVKKFDDPGCLFDSLRGEGAAPAAVYFQHHNQDRWVPDSEAWFATTPQTQTPRGYNWGTYGSFGEAQDAVTGGGGGRILPFDQAKARITKQP
jgi:hypothetical protein